MVHDLMATPCKPRTFDLLAGRDIDPAHPVVCLLPCKGPDGRLSNLLDIRSISFAFSVFSYDCVIGIASESTFITVTTNLIVLVLSADRLCWVRSQTVPTIFPISFSSTCVSINFWATGAIGIGHHVWRTLQHRSAPSALHHHMTQLALV